MTFKAPKGNAVKHLFASEPANNPLNRPIGHLLPLPGEKGLRESRLKHDDKSLTALPKGAVLEPVWQNSAAHFGAQALLFSLSWGVAPGFHRADPLGLNRTKDSPVKNRKTGARALNWRSRNSLRQPFRDL